MKTAIICCAKMEELYILEWIDYHLNLGISHIYICDNNDSDYEYPLSDIVQSYVTEGTVTIENYRDIHDVFLLDAYNTLYHKYSSLYDWVCFIDVDEFITLECDTSIEEFLQREEFSNFDSIGLAWKMYGSNNLLYYQNLPVQERFTAVNNVAFLCIKSIIRGGLDIKIESVHDPKDSQLRRCDVLGNSRVYSGPHLNILLEDIDSVRESYFKVAYIRHYWSKSLEEWLRYRHIRGRIAKITNSDEYRYNIKKFLKYHNLKRSFLKSHEKEINDLISNFEKSAVYKKYYCRIKFLDSTSINQ